MFSVIMPTYNCEKYIQDAIQSVLAQTYTDFELIIVDDGSIDSTYNICLKNAQKYSKISVYQISHTGVSAARNFGLSKAKGKYILFIDGDDTWDVRLLELCAKEQNENELLVFGIRTDFYSSEGELKESQSILEEGTTSLSFTLNECATWIFSHYNMSSPCNKVYSRSVLQQYQISFCGECVYLEDLKFNLDYFEHIEKIKILNCNLYYYRVFLDKKQILKRKFKQLFVNADKLFISVKQFLTQKQAALQDSSVLVNVVLRVYFEELLVRSQGQDNRIQKQYLETLNQNSNFKKVLNAASGKFFFIFKILKRLGFRRLQMWIIKRRYW
ncbi:MAG: glycosyltransferase family 2 protein [Clostridia bacterium]|nr:glycosyltransferase family 2 protein [Clostridia bacterium]